MQIEYSCPLGHQCETLAERDGKPIIKRCAWLVQLAGKSPQSEQQVDELRCAMAWTPILLVENAQTNRGQTAAIESFRNETLKQRGTFLTMLGEAAERRRLINEPL